MTRRTRPHLIWDGSPETTTLDLVDCHGEVSLAPLVLDTPFFGSGLLVLAGVYLVADRLRQVEAVLDFLCLGVFDVLDRWHPAHVVPTGLLLYLKYHRGGARLDVGCRHWVALLQV